MKKIAVVDSNICDKSPFCPVKRVCPENAITQEGNFFNTSVPIIDPNRCIGCGKCVNYCPHKAVSIIKVN